MTPALPSRRALLLAVALLGIALLAGVLSVPVAEMRALGAEEAYVADHLEDADCLETWGADEGAGSREASVANWTVLGPRVHVSMPYAYTTETEGTTLHADAVSEATYLVTPLGTRRAGGDEIAPC